MKKDDDHARQEFTSEAEELLDTLSRDLTDFESQGAKVRPDLVNKIFREIHSLKGLAGMLGFGEISELSHNLEDMLDRLRMGKIAFSKELTDLLYDAVDGLNRLVIGITDPSITALVDVPKLTSRIQQIISSQPQVKPETALSAIDIDEQTRKSLTEYEEHRLLENLKSRNEIFSISVTFDFADFDERLRSLTNQLNDAGEVISTLPAIDAASGTGISFRLLFGTRLNIGSLEMLLGDEPKVRSLRKALAQVPGAVGEVTEDELSLRSVSRTVRVDIGRLDHVMNIVGELIIEKTHLENLTRTLQMQNNRAMAHELSKVTRNFDRKLNDLQKSVIETRMVPIGQIYTKLSRTVRKIARELSKEIELQLRGEDTELDKMMIEELTDPLMHIIRNAMDHGIEPREQRLQVGKPPAGNITLNAYQKGNSVVIDVSDDGRGIDYQKIRAVALKRGLINASETVDNVRAVELLFAPGFSTVDVVSEISGRGVGLDVVRKNIQELKGSIDVISEAGKGTTIRIMLPITLAIIQALIVEAAGERFAIPLTSVEESLRIKARDIRTVERKEVFTLRDLTLPLLHLADAFQLDETRDTASPDAKWFIVVTRAGERLVGLLVDALIRQQEVVIKSIGERLKIIPGIAGATEIGENEIILVIDAGSLIDHFGSAARSARRTRETVA